MNPPAASRGDVDATQIKPPLITARGALSSISTDRIVFFTFRIYGDKKTSLNMV